MSLTVCRLVGVEPVVGVDSPAAAAAAAVVPDVPAPEVAPGDHDNDDHSVGWADDLVPGDANPHELVVPFAAVAAAAGAAHAAAVVVAAAAVPVGYSDDQEYNLGGIRRKQLVAACWARRLAAM